jgi:hypothetical protein
MLHGAMRRLRQTLIFLISTSLQRGDHDREENPGSRFNGFGSKTVETVSWNRRCPITSLKRGVNEIDLSYHFEHA